MNRNSAFRERLVRRRGRLLPSGSRTSLPIRPPWCLSGNTMMLVAMAALLVLPRVLAESADKSMTLDACIRYALLNSRELAKLRITHQGQELTTAIRRGKFRYKLSADADHTVDERDSGASVTLKRELPAGVTVSTTLRGDDGAGDSDSASAAVSISKVLLGGGSKAESMLEIDNSLVDELIAQNNLHKYERELVYQVKRSFYRVVRNYQTLRINELRLERARKNLEHAIERERPLDIATARIEVPENEASVLRARRQIDSAIDDLKILIGMPVKEDLVLDTAFTFAERDVELGGDVAFAHENHEAILNARLQRRKIGNEIPVQRVRRLPKLTLSGTTRQDSDDGINLAGDADTTIGLTMSWEWGGETENLKHEKLLTDLMTKDIDIDDLKEEKTKELRDLVRRLDETLALVKLQERKQEVGERRAELYADRWQNGEIDILEYIRSQNDLENTRIQLVNEQTTYMELLGEYEFAVGR